MEAKALEEQQQQAAMLASNDSAASQPLPGTNQTTQPTEASGSVLTN